MSTTDKIFAGLLIFIPLALVGYYTGVSPLALFILCAFAIVPLAKYMGEATEELTVHTGPVLGGLMNATFGNATELIIGIFALQAGLLEVVKASIIGSMLSNLLLVLGAAMFFGGIRFSTQSFSTGAAKTTCSTLLLTTAAFVIPAIFVQTNPPAASVEALSIIAAVLLLAAYASSLFFSLWTHQHLYTQDVGKYEPKWSTTKSIFILLAAMIVVSIISEILVGAIRPLVQQFGWTELFIGVVLLAIIGNAAEHVSAITIAMKNKMELAFQVAIGSATQIGMFVAPALVLLSLSFGRPMDLVFGTLELGALLLSVLVVNAVVEDGKSNWFEGLQLIITYAVIAGAFFLHA